MNINEHSTKAAIIDAACELTDTQAQRINDLQERQAVLWALCGMLALALIWS